MDSRRSIILAGLLLLGLASYWTVVSLQKRAATDPSNQNAGINAPDSTDGPAQPDPVAPQRAGEIVTGNGVSVPTPVPATAGRVESPNSAYPELREGSPPRLIAGVPAIFPWEASAEGLTDGWASVEFTVRADGAVEDVVLREASFWAFAEPAVEAVTQYLYEPATVDDRPIAVTDMTTRVEFDILESFPDPPSIRDLDSPDRALSPIVKVQPPYPKDAAEQAIGAGFVVVEFTVNEDGGVAEVSIVESSSPLFEDAAIDSAGRWKYLSKRVDGQAVAVNGVRARIDFPSP